MAPKKLLTPLLLLAIATAGCTPAAGVGANVDATASTGGNTAAPTTGGNAAAQAYYAAGRMWEYSMKTVTAGNTMNGTIKIEVSEVKDGKATLKVTTTMPPAAAMTHTSTVDVNDQSGFNSALQSGQNPGAPALKATSTESVSVPAGTYTATKHTYEHAQDGATGTLESWLADGVGMVKQVQTMKPSTASMPSVPGMPGGMTMDLSTTVTMELVKFNQ